MRATLIGLVVLALFAGACSASEPAVLSISIASDGGTAEGQIDVTVTLTNGTDRTLTLVRPTHVPNFVAFVVLDANGTRMPFYGRTFVLHRSATTVS